MKLLLLLAPIISGCTTLSVDVAIFDRACKDSASFVEAGVVTSESRVLKNIANGDYQIAKSTLSDAVITHARNLVALGVLAVDDEQPLSENLIEAINKRLDEARFFHRQGVDKVALARSEPRDTERATLFFQAQQHFSDGDRLLTELAYSLADEFRETADLSSLPAEDVIRVLTKQKKFAQATSKDVKGLIGGAGILDDPIASLVVNADNSCWKGKFNQAYGNGVFGNADIAVKMESLGEFSLKGLRLDARNATTASFKVIQQSIKLFAASYGVPLPSPDTPDAPLAAQLQELAEAERVQLVAKRNRQRLRQSAVAVLDVIAKHRKDLSQLPARETAVSNIKQTYAVYRSLLVPVSED